MKKRNRKGTNVESSTIDLDPETIADLETGDAETDTIKGGRTTSSVATASATASLKGSVAGSHVT